MTRAIQRLSMIFGVFCIGSLVMVSAQSSERTAQGTGAAPTFSKDVAPVLYKHCTSCHRPGEIAPMSLMTYEEARPWARSIRDKVATGAMPPWHADPAYGKWQHDRRLSAAEKDIITRWVAAGAPAGDPKDLPAKPVYAEGWAIGSPDLVLTMASPYDVPAHGEIPYQYFEVETNLTEDRWVQALEIRPGNRSVVHHVLVYARSPDMPRRMPVFRPANPEGPLPPNQKPPSPEEQTSARRRGPLFTQTAPGTPPTILEPGSAMRLRAGTVLTFQIHYTTSGKPASDRTSIGFKFAKQPPANEVRATAMMNSRFIIPAGAANHPVESGMEFLEDVTIYGLVPHTHLRGKSWEYRLAYPDGRSEILLAVPQYDFNWQTEYVFATPLRVPKGAILKAVAHYDNSQANKANPDPAKDVYWGDQTWEEMQYTGINYSVDKDRLSTTSQGQKQ
jgi:hypothetical protein